ncbi:MAG: hypothetical protein KDB23_26065, partial [Planctomycetales bacterium]|nr:hypothetical protein [Planctomycetales bacterium]
RSLRPKYPLDDAIDSLRSTTSFSAVEQLDLMRLLSLLEQSSPTELKLVLQQLGVSWIVGPNQDPGADTIEVYSRIPNPTPLAWIVHDFAVVPSTNSNRDVDYWRQVFFENRAVRDLRRQVVLEAPPDTRIPASRELSANESCQIVDADMNSLVVNVTLTEPGFLVTNQRYASGWHAARVASDSEVALPLVRANGMMRAVQLPAGTYRVKFRYRPRSVILGAMISLATLVLIGLSFAINFKRARGA